MINYTPTCEYCKEKASESIPIVSMYAPGTYYQHWNFEHQFGCFGNPENYDPRGVKVETNLPVYKYYIVESPSGLERDIVLSRTDREDHFEGPSTIETEWLLHGNEVSMPEGYSGWKIIKEVNLYE